MSTEIEYIAALTALQGNRWSWAYVSYVEGAEDLPDTAYISIYQDIDGIPVDVITHRVEVINPYGGVYKLLQHLLKKDGRRIIKARNNPGSFSEYRAYRNGVRIPDHIISRGIDVTNLCEERI